MVVGVLTLDIEIPAARSLKDKRRVLNGLKARIRNKFNASAAETDYNDLWNRAELGVAVVSNETRNANSELSAIVSFVESSAREFLLEDVSMEFLHV